MLILGSNYNPKQNLIHSVVHCFILHLTCRAIRVPELVLFQVPLLFSQNQITIPAIIPLRGYTFKGVN